MQRRSHNVWSTLEARSGLQAIRTQLPGTGTEPTVRLPAFAEAGLFELGGLLYVNTTALHARAAFDYAVA